MNKSETITELAAALAKAQQKMKRAKKDSANPFFKSKYADLSSVAEACMEALNEHGLSVIQCPVCNESGAGVETILGHESGQWISEVLILPVSKQDAQSMGSAITYARRYALAGFAGVCPEDDDGAAAAKGTATLRDRSVASLERAAAGGMEQLEAAWKALPADARRACADVLPALKEKAAVRQVDHAAA